MSNLSGRNKNSKNSVKNRVTAKVSKTTPVAKMMSSVPPLSTYPKPKPFSETPVAGASAGPHADVNSKSKRWSFIQNDLEKALDTWEELEKGQTILSPEEEQLNKIKTIIGQLKDKLNQF